MKKLIIGIAGIKQSGKDTTATYIRGILNVDVATMYWAAGVKRVAAAALGLHPNYFFNDKAKEKEFIVGTAYSSESIQIPAFMSGRALLQHIGTECFRDNIHRDFWVTMLMQGLANRPERVILIPDTRFPNEYQAIKNEGGYIIHVKRPKVQTDDLHSSETALNGYSFDAEIDNDGPYLAPSFILGIHKFLESINENPTG